MDTGPSPCLSRGPVPGCEDPWAAREGRVCGLTERRSLARRLTERRSLRLPCRAECAFPLRRCSGGAGRNPPPDCGALWKVTQLGKCARATPRQAAGGLLQDPQAPAWGLAVWKDAVWAEGLADGAPWVRPGHHQAASCGLRRCRELGLREFVWVVASLPWRRGGCHRQAATQECTQICETGLSEPFWGICVHCCAVVDR